MNRYWISWWQPGDDPRPLHFPPKDERVLGWWESGTDGRRSSICAMVVADNVESARAAVLTDWPESRTAVWRFADVMRDRTPTDRFPLSDWMAQRIAQEDACGVEGSKP